MLKSSVKNYGLLTSFLLVCAVSFFVGCSSKNVAPEVSSNAGLSVTANPSTVTTGETSVVEATISDNGSAVANQEVTFSVVPSTAGYFSPATDTTDASGIAATVFTATTSGSVTVTVSVNGSSLTQNIGMIVTDVAQNGSGNVNISLTPSLLLANGQDTSRINVTVRDGAGNLAPESTLVKFAAGEKFDDIDGNGSFTVGVDTVIYDANSNGSWDAIGIIPATAYTNSSGLASVDFISGYDATTVYIVATVDDGGITGFAETTLQLSPNATMSFIYMSSDSMSLSVKQTGGVESSVLRAVGMDINGNPVPEGMNINFVIIDGPNGGEHLGNVGYGPFIATTNSQGVATATVHSGTISGTIRIRAYADTVLSNASQVLVTAGPPAYVEIGSETCNAQYWDNVGDHVLITATVADIYLNPVNDSTVVYFSADEGTMKSHEERTKDHEGIATTKWFAGHNVPTADGVVMIMAETAGGTVADTALFYSTHYTSTITVSGYSASLRADGLSFTTARLDGADLNGNPVIIGTLIEAKGFLLKATGGILQNGCGVATALSEISSSTLLEDLSLTGGNDDGIGATGSITYIAKDAGASTTIYINLTTGFAYSSNSKIEMEASVAQNTTLPIEFVVIQDRYANPLGDHTLVMTASAGTVVGGTGTQETNGFGEATGFQWTSPGVAGDVIITITDTDPRGGVILTKKVTVN